MKVVIVIPMHRETLKENEKVSLGRCKEVFGNYDVVLVHPEGMNTGEYEKYNVISRFLPMKRKFFSNEIMYNRLLNLPYFYKPFIDYDYMLIYQLDTFVFENNLDEWCRKGYDYIGAPWVEASWIKKMEKKYPWIKKVIYPVGNGGLSLRKVKTFYYGSMVLRPISYFWKGNWHEDFFWSSIAKRLLPGFKVPDVKEALDFAFEEHPELCFEMNGNQLPFGCHAWEKFGTEFWKPHFKKYGWSIDSIV